MTSSLRVHRKGAIARIELSGPDGLPRLELSLLGALDREFDSLFREADCGGIVLHGTEKCFAAGANLAYVGELNGIEAFEFARLGQRLYQKIHRAPKPVVAAISGYCMGGAWDLAMACHARVCTPDSVFRHPGPAIGIFSGWGGTQRLPRYLNSGRAYSLLLEGKRISAAEALELGLVDEMAVAERALARAEKLAERAAARSKSHPVELRPDG